MILRKNFTLSYYASLFLAMFFGCVRGQDIRDEDNEIDLEGRQAAKWSYPPSPGEWPALCFAGVQQTPIAITSGDTFKVYFPKMVFQDFKRAPGQGYTATNNGHSLDISINDGSGINPTISRGGLGSTFKFYGMHFHWGSDNGKGSEHKLNGRTYPMELHMVFVNTKYDGQAVSSAAQNADALAVLGVFVELSLWNNPSFNGIINAISSVKEPETKTKIDGNSFVLNQFLPKTRSFYRYRGSLTTPGCNEAVEWTVFDEPIKISKTQLEKFRTLLNDDKKPMQDNFRPTQPLNGRVVLKSKFLFW